MSSLDSSAAEDDWIGTAPPTDKPTTTFRIAFNNINGLGSQQYGHSIQQLVESQSALGIDLLGIIEHCLNTEQPRVRNTLQRSLQQHFLGRYVLQINSGQMQTTSAYLPGGTATLLVDRIVGRLESNGRGGDTMGRWSCVTLRRQKQKPLTVYAVYKVNAKPTNDIGITAWHQQRLQLDSQHRHNEHPRDAFTKDLIKAITNHQALGHDIIVGGDFNDTLFQPNSQLLKLATSVNLIDPWTRLYPEHENFKTYQRGTKRIDSMLCSHSVAFSVRSMGYSPFNWLTNSDHRALVIDFDEKALFGRITDPLPSPQLRGIKSNDRQQVATFVEKWHNHLTENNVFNRIRNLKNHNTPHQEVEALDFLIGQGGDSAEQQCRRRRAPMFTTRLTQLRAIKSIVVGNLAALKQGKPHTAIFQSRLALHGLDFTLATDTKTASSQYKSVKQELQSIVSKHREMRIKEQALSIERALDAGKKNKAKLITNIQRQEARRHTWQTLRFVRMQQGLTQKIDRIDIPESWPDPTTIMPHLSTLEDPKQCRNWKTVTKPDDVEYYLQLRNRCHFGQAQGTPLTVAPLVDSINWPANSETSERILAGEYTSTISDVPQCAALLDACRAVSELDLLPDTISFLDFKGKINSWKENTSTSPSGRHLGRYKALFAQGSFTCDPDGDPDTNDRYKKLSDAQRDIADVIIAIINHCITTGYVLDRWKTIINTMIFKEVGNYQIHRLRVIHIYEADFNLLLAIKWRQLLQSADQRQLINQGLYGGRPGCEAQSLTFLEELKYDVSHVTRRTLFNFDNDATSCYDRIIVALASLINRKYGLHRNVVLVHATTLQEAKFHLRTKLGYSESSYSHQVEFPIFGSGQGSGNSPSIWLFISSTLCDIHQQISHGAKFVSPDGEEEVKITMVGFVDDCTGTCNDFQPQTQADTSTIASRMQHDAQTWNDLLWCTGGKLELPKCSFHTLHFTFLPNGTPKTALVSNSSQIQITDAATGEVIQIPS